MLFEHSFPQSGNNLHISGQSLSEKALVTLYSCNEPNIFDIFRTVQPDLILALSGFGGILVLFQIAAQTGASVTCWWPD